MRLRYDDDLVEAAVFLAAAGRRPGVPPAQIRRYQRERERCYEILDPDDRNAAFLKVQLDWFREWEMEKLLLEVVNEYPLLPRALATLAFRKVRTKKDEGAELYVSAENGRSAVVAMRSERFERDDAVAALLRHEFMHLSDMVDPQFCYSPHVHAPGLGPTQQRITRERYRLIWDITIDGRLYRSGRGSFETREQHAAIFDRSFSFWPPEQRSRVFESHWSDPAPNHERLLALAADPRDCSASKDILPGSLCPLCQFPTFEWANTSALRGQTVARVREQFPQWTPEHGACGRCVEVYDLAGKFELPSTVVL